MTSRMIHFNSNTLHGRLNPYPVITHTPTKPTAFGSSSCRIKPEIDLLTPLVSSIPLVAGTNNQKQPLHNPQSSTTSRPAIKQRIVKKRDRKILSCTQCRDRKLKCDKGRPCARCEEIGEDCVYIHNASELQQAPKRNVKKRKRPISVCWTCRERKIPCDKAQPCTPCTKSGFECIYKRFDEANSPSGPASHGTGQVPAIREAHRLIEPAATSSVNTLPSLPSNGLPQPLEPETYFAQAYAPNAVHERYDPVRYINAPYEAGYAPSQGPTNTAFTYLQPLPPLQEVLNRPASNHATRILEQGNTEYQLQSSGLRPFQHPNQTACYHHKISDLFEYVHASSRTAIPPYKYPIKTDLHLNNYHTTTQSQSHSQPITFQYNHSEHHNHAQHHNYSKPLSTIAATRPCASTGPNFITYQHDNTKHHARSSMLPIAPTPQQCSTVREEHTGSGYNQTERHTQRRTPRTTAVSQPGLKTEGNIITTTLQPGFAGTTAHMYD